MKANIVLTISLVDPCEKWISLVHAGEQRITLVNTCKQWITLVDAGKERIALVNALLSVSQDEAQGTRSFILRRELGT